MKAVTLQLEVPNWELQVAHSAAGKSPLLQTESAYFIGMKALQIEYPKSWPAAVGSSAEQFEGEARMALAMKLFEMGRLTSGRAAQLAGVSRVAFLLSCPQWNVPAVSWDSAEIDAEFKPLQS